MFLVRTKSYYMNVFEANSESRPKSLNLIRDFDTISVMHDLIATCRHEKVYRTHVDGLYILGGVKSGFV